MPGQPRLANLHAMPGRSKGGASTPPTQMQQGIGALAKTPCKASSPETHSPFGPISRGMTGSLGGRAVTEPLEAEVCEGTVERNSVSEGIETKLSGKRIPSCGAMNEADFGNSPPEDPTDGDFFVVGSATATALGAAQDEINTATDRAVRVRNKDITFIEWR